MDADCADCSQSPDEKISGLPKAKELSPPSNVIDDKVSCTITEESCERSETTEETTIDTKTVSSDEAQSKIEDELGPQNLKSDSTAEPTDNSAEKESDLTEEHNNRNTEILDSNLLKEVSSNEDVSVKLNDANNGISLALQKSLAHEIETLQIKLMSMKEQDVQKSSLIQR